MGCSESGSEPLRGVYFLRCALTGLTKIGSGDVADRVRTHRTGSPTVLWCVSVVNGGKTEEQAFHARWAHRCAHGEWFQLGVLEVPATQHDVGPFNGSARATACVCARCGGAFRGLAGAQHCKRCNRRLAEKRRRERQRERQRETRAMQGFVHPGIYLTFEGIEDTISGWARRIGAHHTTLLARLRRGLSIDDVLAPPGATSRDGRRRITQGGPPGAGRRSGPRPEVHSSQPPPADRSRPPLGVQR